MGLVIGDGKGNGTSAGVTSKNRLQVASVNFAEQRFVSETENTAFQVQGDFASVNNSTFTVLHIENDSTTRLCIVTYMRMQPVGLTGGNFGTATYFTIGVGQLFSSGGTAVTPVNTFGGSSLTSGVTAYDNNPTLTGTFSEIDRWYPAANQDENTYRKEGSIILPQGQGLSIKITSDHTSGTAAARISFLMEKAEE